MLCYVCERSLKIFSTFFSSSFSSLLKVEMEEDDDDDKQDMVPTNICVPHNEHFVVCQRHFLFLERRPPSPKTRSSTHTQSIFFFFVFVFVFYTLGLLTLFMLIIDYQLGYIWHSWVARCNRALRLQSINQSLSLYLSHCDLHLKKVRNEMKQTHQLLNSGHGKTLK